MKLLTVLISIVLLSGCTELRKMTYPENFVYIDKQDLQNNMYQLNASLAKLEVFIPVASASDADRKNVIEELNRINKIAVLIRGKGEYTNHLVIDEHMDKFLSDIDNAKLFAEQTPPNYFYAGKLAGSCAGCHQYR